MTTLDKSLQARITARISRFEDGNFGHYKMIGDGVIEARFFFGTGYRVYFSIHDQKIIWRFSMPTRSRNWNEEISHELRNKSYAQNFIQELLSEGDDLQTALGRLVRLYGVKEYAKLVNMDEPAIQRAINPEHNPTKQTLEKLLAPLNLKLGVKPKDAA